MGLYHKGLDLQKREKKVSKVEKDVEKNEVNANLEANKVDSTLLEGKERTPSKEFRTGIDRLYHLIVVSKQISIEQTKEILNEDEEHLENWIKILDNQGLINVNYPPTGGTLLTPIGVKPKFFSIKKLLHWGKEDDTDAS